MDTDKRPYARLTLRRRYGTKPWLTRPQGKYQAMIGNCQVCICGIDMGWMGQMEKEWTQGDWILKDGEGGVSQVTPVYQVFITCIYPHEKLESNMMPDCQVFIMILIQGACLPGFHQRTIFFVCFLFFSFFLFSLFNFFFLVFFYFWFYCALLHWGSPRYRTGEDACCWLDHLTTHPLKWPTDMPPIRKQLQSHRVQAS